MKLLLYSQGYIKSGKRISPNHTVKKSWMNCKSAAFVEHTRFLKLQSKHLTQKSKKRLVPVGRDAKGAVT